VNILLTACLRRTEPRRTERGVRSQNSGVRIAALAFALSAACAPARGQDADFDLALNIDTRSAEEAVALFQGQGGHPDEIARLRGSQIALATTAVLSHRDLTLAALQRSLEAAKFNQTIDDDAFRIKEARANAGAIADLLAEIGRRNFGQKVVATVAQLFPPGTRLKTSLPLYFVAFGHQNIDAYVRRVVWDGDVPRFVGEGEGELTIVVNLAKAVSYGQTVDDRFVGMMSIVAHEVFHAAFGAYKDASPQWQQYYAAHRTPFDRLLDLTQNEGIAYYLTLIQHSRGRLPNGWEQNVQSNFAQFNASAAELLSGRISPSRANDIIQQSNASGYWNNFGSITGMIIARQIDGTLGRAALSSTIADGPDAFFRTYIDLMRRDSSLPRLSDVVTGALSRR